MGGGGVSGTQKNAAATGLANTAGGGSGMMDQQTAMLNRTQAPTTNYFQSRMTGGLPFYRNLTDYNSGAVAQAFAPQRADILRRTGTYSFAPSGYRDALMTSLGAQQGRAFDSTLTQAMMANEMAKQQGAAGMQGQEQIAGNLALGGGNLASGANQTLLNGPAKPSPWGPLGGAIGAGLQTAGMLAMA